mgnify:CR=1 FL=1
MTKALEIRPKDVFKEDTVAFRDIPVNRFSQTAADLKGELGTETLVRI